MTLRETGRWDVGVSLGLVAGALGVVVGSTPLFLSAVVGFTYATYGYATRTPDPDVSLSRSLSETNPTPGEDVIVTLTATNEGDEPISELRVLDEPPAELEVVDGSPRWCASLRPGESAGASYRVRARRGTHEFGTTTLVARNVSGSVERTVERRADGRLSCEVAAADVELAPETIPFAGRVPTDAGGEGVEFYSVREYQSGDPTSRVDWKRYARTRELTTIEFRETRAATVVAVLDARDAAAAYRREGEPTARNLAARGIAGIAESLLDRNDRVGAAVYGGDRGYLPPGTGPEQYRRVEAVLDLDAEIPPAVRRRQRDLYAPDEPLYETLEDRLPEETQVVFATPLLDDHAVHALRYLRARGHAVAVVSPDVTGDETPGATVERLRREGRVETLREHGVRVVNWPIDEPLRSALTRAGERWSS